MNKLKLIFLMSCCLSSVSFAAGARQAKSFLTESESKTLVRDVNNVCSDTWCISDFNYGFDQLVCNKSECYFDIKVITRNDSIEGKKVRNHYRSYRCELQGFQGRDDLLSPTLTFSDKLFEAISSCIFDEVPKHMAAVYVPKSSSCLKSLRPDSSSQSASHSVLAEAFYASDDKVAASAETLAQMVRDYAAKDASCVLEFHTVFKDEISCKRLGTSDVCSLPTDQGRFVLVKDAVDGAAVIYIDQKAKRTKLGSSNGKSLTLNVAQPEACYNELLNLDGKQSPQLPFDSSDHHSYFVSSKNLNLTQDARENSVQLINAAVASVKNSEGSSCQAETAPQTIDKNACKNLGGIDICVIPGGNAGYYVVTKDTADGAYVSFLRYD